MKRKFLPFVNRRYVTTIGFPACTEETLPETNFNFCNPEVNLSEIQRIFLQKISAPAMTDWSQPEQWTSIMSETSTAIDAMRVFTVIGDKPAPAVVEKEISNQRKFVTRKTHTINFTVDETSATNHTFLQGVENGKRYKMRYEIAGGLMFGGSDGIVVEIKGDMILARGPGEVMVYQYTATWVSPQTEDRIQSPIFGETVLGSESLDTTITFAVSADVEHETAEFILDDGTDPVSRFSYDNINPTIGTPITMTIKIATVLYLTCIMTSDYIGQPFSFTDSAAATHTGYITNGEVNF